MIIHCIHINNFQHVLCYFVDISATENCTRKAYQEHMDLDLMTISLKLFAYTFSSDKH